MEITAQTNHYKEAKLTNGKIVTYDYYSKRRKDYDEIKVNLKYLGQGFIHAIDGVKENNSQVMHFFKKKPRTSPMAKLTDGTEVKYDCAGDSINDYADEKDNLIYLGTGVISKGNNIKQNSTEVLHFWKNK